MKNSRIFLKGKTILIGVVISVIATVLIVYLSGLDTHRSLLNNSLISLTILALVFFFFLTVGLYKGLHIHDNLSYKLKLAWGKPKSSIFNSSSFPDTPGVIDSDDGISGILFSIILWIIMTILFIVFLILLEFVLWAVLLALIGLIYWILMRALKLIFSKSSECQNDLIKSVTYGTGYTALYLGWLYGVIYIATLF